MYVALQKPGDLVYLPPDALALSYCVTASNGTALCADVSWQVHTPQTLARGLESTLPRLRSMATLEGHKTKAMAYFALSTLAKHEGSSPLWAHPKTQAETDMYKAHAEDWLSLLKVVHDLYRDECIDDDIICSRLLFFEGPRSHHKPS